MKKLSTYIALFLIAFGFTSPLVNAIQIEASATGVFQTTFADNELQDLPDYEINSTGTVLNTVVDLEANANEKTLTYVFPDGIDIKLLPETNNELSSVTSQVNDTTGETTVVLTYTAESATISNVSSIGFNVRADDFHSGKVYTITSSLDYQDLGQVDSNVNTITMHDYSAKGTVRTSIMPTSEPIILDAPAEFEIYNLYTGEYKDIASTDLALNFKDIEIDLSKILVDVNGDGTFKTVGELGLLGGIIPDPSLNYNSSTGIITLDDLTIKSRDNERTHINLTFDSSVFSNISKLTIPTDIYSSTITENDSTVEVPQDHLAKGPYTFVNNELEIEAYLDDGAQLNAIKPNTDDLDLFSFIIKNKGYDLNDTTFTIDIPAGMTITQINNNSRGDELGDITITDENSNVTSLTSYGQKYVLDNAITGPQTITVNVDSMKVLDQNTDVSDSYQDSGLRFIGSVTGNEGDIATVTLNEEITTSYTDNQGQVNSGTMGNDVDPEHPRDLDLNITEKQTPSVKITDYTFLDTNGDALTAAELGDEVTISTSIGVNTNEFYYGSSYKYLDDPVIFISIPSSLKSVGNTFTKDDVTISTDGVDNSSHIASVEELDPSLSVYEGGKLLRIELTDFTVDNDLTTINIATVVDESVTKSQSIENIDSSVVVDTTDVDNYLGLEGIVGTDTVIDGPLNTQPDITEGTQVGNNPTSRLTVIIPAAVGAKTFVDTDNSDIEDYRNVTSTSDENEYPDYYIGDTGTYQLQVFNTFTFATNEMFSNYVVFPDLSEYNGTIDVDNIVVDTQGSQPDDIYYTSDTITSTTGWENGIYGDTTWTTTPPADGKITAVRYDFADLQEDTQYTVYVPYTTEYAKTEDSVSYDSMIKGQSIYAVGNSNSTNGATAGMVVRKSRAPQITLNSINDGDDYTYSTTSTFLSDVLDYSVTDDRTSELVTYDDTNGFEDGQADNMAAIDVTYTDADGNVTTYDRDTFENMTDFKAGTYEISYKTEQDADAQTASEDITVTISAADAVIDAVDYSVDYFSAPTSDSELVSDMQAVATDYDGTDLTGDIVVESTGGYDVSNPKVGTYTINFEVAGENKTVVSISKELTVTADDASVDGTDVTLTYSQVPTNEADLLLAFNAVGTEYNGDDLTGDVTISDYGTFDFSNYTYTSYTMTLEVTGVSENPVYKDVVLTVIADDSSLTASDYTVDLSLEPAPVTEDEVKSLMNVNAIDTTSEDITSEVTISDLDGYDYADPQIGVYSITYTVPFDDGSTGTVTNVLTVTAPDATIDGSDITLRYSEVPTNEADLLVAFKAAAADYDNTDITSDVKVSDYGVFDFNNYTYTSYTMTLEVTGVNENPVYTDVVLTVVKDEASIVAEDYTVDLSKEAAPVTEGEIIDLMNVSAIDTTSEDITSDVTISDLGGYDYSDPQLGSYEITFTVPYDDGSTGTVTHTLTVIAPDANIDVIDVTISYEDIPETIDHVQEIFENLGELTHGDFDGSDISDSLEITNVDSLDFDEQIVAGDYQFIFSVTGMNGNTVSKLAVLTILPGPSVITASDATVAYKDAPINDGELINVLSASAVDYLDDDISSKLIITNYGGYDFEDIQTGSYEITFETTDGLSQPVTVTLTVTEDSVDIETEGSTDGTDTEEGNTGSVDGSESGTTIQNTGLTNYSIYIVVLILIIITTMFIKNRKH